MWLETFVQPNGIHNRLSRPPFTHAERQFLTNGLRFIPTPPSSEQATASFARQYLSEPQKGWMRFSRTLATQLLHEESDDPASAPVPSKFRIARPCINVSWTEDQQRSTPSFDTALLDQYRAATHAALVRAVTSARTSEPSRATRSNHSTADHRFLQRLMNDKTITIKPADKNLGMVLVDTSWYDAELRRMLRDTVTYRTFHPGREFIVVHGRRTKLTRLVLQQQLYQQLKHIVKQHESTISIQQPELAPAIIQFLTRKVTPDTCVIPTIYLLLKVHKPGGLRGRPIVPSTRWLTTSASVVVDHLLQDIFRKANIPWIVKDTKSLIVDLEAIVLPGCDSVFVTADIASLYTNIDTEVGLRMVRDFLREQKVDQHLSSLIMELLEFVMRNSYLQFHDTVYRQIDGAAMGTACAPVYANIVVYMLERSVIAEFTSNGTLHCYRRFLDDIWTYMSRHAAAEFQSRMNELHPKLKFEFVQTDHESAFLDLTIFKGERFHTRHVVDLRCHQKSMNLYLYIPWHSYHPLAAKRSFIQTELMRYIRNSSARREYLQLKQVFFQRLRDRGYPIAFLEEIFNAIHYCDRPYFLAPSSQPLPQHPLFYAQPPVSLCLQRRLTRQKTSTATAIPTVFVIPYSPLSHTVPTRALLCRHWSLINMASHAGLPPPLVAYQSLPSLGKTLVFARAMMLEMERRRQSAAASPAKATQLTLTSWRL
jgi:hypothetical protein